VNNGGMDRGARVKKKTTYLPGQFPKECACGAVYSLSEWLKLQHCGVWHGTLDGKRKFDDLEMRNCWCKSTIMVKIEEGVC
jgi:hypothetical protein